MSKLFFITLVFSVNAFASKARVQALANSFHLNDTQRIFSKPIDVISLDNLVAFETGITKATSADDNAEGMIVYSLKENNQIAVAFGHLDESVVDARNLINALSGSTFEMPQNPINIFYTVKDNITSYVFGVFYSNKNDKVALLNETSSGLNFGVEMGKLQINSVVTLKNSVETAAGKKFDGSGYWQTTATYLLDDSTVELTYITANAKMSTVTGAVVTDNESHVKNVIMLGLADSIVKDDNDFFWGAQVISTLINCKINLSAGCDKSFTRTILPVWIGLEAQASDWLTFRGTIKQSFLINISKDDFGYPATAVSGATGAVSNVPTGSNDTVVSTGLGFKFKKITLDGSLSTGTTQILNMTNFLSQLGLTYNF